MNLYFLFFFFKEIQEITVGSNNDMQQTMNIFNIQVSVSIYSSPLVETRSSWGNGYSRARAKKVQDEPESPEDKEVLEE